MNIFIRSSIVLSSLVTLSIGSSQAMDYDYHYDYDYDNNNSKALAPVGVPLTPEEKKEIRALRIPFLKGLTGLPAEGLYEFLEEHEFSRAIYQTAALAREDTDR